MGQERITLTRVELHRYKVIRQHVEGFITGGEAAELLGISIRQVYRLKKRVLEEGEMGIIHKNRGRKPAHAIPDEMRKIILELYTSDRYRDCNDHHFAELLAKHEGIEVSPSTVRRIRCDAQMKPKRKRRTPKAHRPRERKPQAGMLVQMDASPHHWLEDRAEPFSLHAAIDDATGKIVAATFRSQEDAAGYFMITQQMIEKHGIPMGIYSDRHTIFRSPNEKQTIEQELAGEPMPLSQFGQALKELGITHIKATTPQTKGRIERLFQTLQDRWVVELRIRGVNTLEGANKILPELIEDHNQKFAVEPQEPESAFVPLQPGQSLDLILCFRDRRTLGPGETISYQGKTYKIHTTEQKQAIPVKTRVEVRKTLDGKLFIWYNGKGYPLRETTKPQHQTAPKKEKASSEKKPHKPAANHPWRQFPKSRIPRRA
jgi:transposase